MESSEMGKKIFFGVILFFLISFMIGSVKRIASKQREIESKQSFKQSLRGTLWNGRSKTIMDVEVEMLERQKTKHIVITLIMGIGAILCLYGLMKSQKKMKEITSEWKPSSTSKPKFCASCGNKIILDDKFCSNCGVKIEEG